MNVSYWRKSVVLMIVTVGVVASTVVFGVLHHDDGDNRIDFVLTNQSGQRTTEQDLAGQHLLVFFGFTHCSEICPTQMSKLSQVMASLDQAGYRRQVKPVLISVDPERDDVEQMASYLTHFDRDFVGLTGSRAALGHAARRFKTILRDAPPGATPGYQLTHSSIVYVVDPSSRVIDYIPFDEARDDTTKRIVALLQ